MHDLERFAVQLKNRFLPLVYAQGFTAGDGVFRRVKGERTDIVSLQGSRQGRRCCIALGAHYSFLTSAGRPEGVPAEQGKLKQHDCVFRDRLHEEGQPDQWWSYGLDAATAEASAADLVQTFERRAHLFFARFEPFPEVFDGVTPAHLESGDSALMPGGHTPAHAALTMARLMRHLGRDDRCREFAEFGLRHLGSATRLRLELELLARLG